MHPMSKQRLLFITTGGTIASVRTDQGLKPVLSSQELLAHLPGLQELCQPETLALCSIDSTDLGPEHWLSMARAVQENYALYDGFIICHGTDTLAYSAAALSYLIQNADKPIILTGAQQPISHEITDAKKNLRDSVDLRPGPGQPRGHGGIWRAGHRRDPGQKGQDHQLRRLCIGQLPHPGPGAGGSFGAVYPLSLACRSGGVWPCAEPPCLFAETDPRPWAGADPGDFPPVRLRDRGELWRGRRAPASDGRLCPGPGRLRPDRQGAESSPPR